MNTSFSVTVITELNLQFVALQVEVANTRKGAMKKVMSTRLGLVILLVTCSLGYVFVYTGGVLLWEVVLRIR